jgi:hypothetical protein
VLGQPSPTAAAFEVVESRYPRPPFREWYWSGPTRFYGNRDLVAEFDSGDGWLWVATRTEAAFREFDRLLEPTGMRWEAWSDERPPGCVTRGLGP